MKRPAVLAMDIGGTNLRFALVSTEGSILCRTHLPCRIGFGRDVFLTDIVCGCQKIVSSAADSGHDVVAVGAGVPGLLNLQGEIISSVNLRALDGFALREWLTATLSVPAVALNDANAASMAEYGYGAGRSFGTLLHFTLGTGVGSGLILNGKLWTGIDGIASEYGHATVEPDGYKCQCGNRGCLEQYASAAAIARFAREKCTSGVASKLAGIPTDSIDASVVASAAREGDLLALECLAKAGRYLGIAAASAVNMLNPEAIILGGGVSESFDMIAPAMGRELKGRAFAVPASRVKLLKGELGDNAGILGAAAAAWDLVQQ